MTSHHRVGDAIARSIPTEAAVSAQPNLNPHVSGRKTLYRFPYIGDAEYIFLDVSSLANKSDQYGQIRQLVAGDEFGLVRAEDGYLLLRRGAPRAPLPEAFGQYAVVPKAADGTLLHQPQYRTDILFGDALRLVGFDILDGRHTEMPQTPLRFFFYWQALKPLPEDYRFALYLLDQNRKVIGTIDLGELPGVQSWYPPTHWQPGETIKMEISDMPWWTGQFAKYGVALGVLSGDNPWAREARLLPQIGGGDLAIPLADEKTLAELMNFRTDPGGMPERSEARPATELPRGTTAQSVQWTNGAELLGYRIADNTVSPGDGLDVTLYWRAPKPLDKDYKDIRACDQRRPGDRAARRRAPSLAATRPRAGPLDRSSRTATQSRSHRRRNRGAIRCWSASTTPQAAPAPSWRRAATRSSCPSRLTSSSGEPAGVRAASLTAAWRLAILDTYDFWSIVGVVPARECRCSSRKEANACLNTKPLRKLRLAANPFAFTRPAEFALVLNF